MKSIVYIVVLLACLTGCGKIAIATAPSRTPDVSSDHLSESMQHQFMEILHSGEYDKIDTTIEQLTAAYLQQPNDPKTNLYLGMAHLWAVAERNRLHPVPARIIERLTLADFYLGEASSLNPDDARIVGFQAAARMAMGSVHNVEKWKRMGYFEAKDAISDYPEFNLFVLSNSMIQLPAHDPTLSEAEEALWQTAEVCFDRKIDPAQLEVSAIQADIIQAQKNFSGSQRDRACFNSEIAPHNIEGFFLHFGDVLAKTGNQVNASIMYQLASTTPSSSSWPYQKVAASRLDKLSAMVQQFHNAKRVEDEPEIMARSGYACVACHEK